MNGLMAFGLAGYLAIGFVFASGFMSLIKNPPHYDKDWELYRTAFYVDPAKSGAVLFIVCLLFWPGIVFTGKALK